MTATGKIQKHILRKWIATEVEAENESATAGAS